MRYPTLGDYYYKKDGTLKFEIAETGNFLYNKMILVHELIEQALTERRGITAELIDAFDLNYEKERESGKHGKGDEPGFDIRCPYYPEHTLATAVEMIICAHVGVSWAKYEDDLNEI